MLLRKTFYLHEIFKLEYLELVFFLFLLKQNYLNGSFIYIRNNFISKNF